MKKPGLILLVLCNACATSSKQAVLSQAGDPACIGQMIKKFETEVKQNPPRSIYIYRYREQLVYYVPALCCDQFSDLYDSSCNLLGHPDGGFSGKGDGNYPDFDKTRTGEKLVWKDSR